jgi:hypothetical protein
MSSPGSPTLIIETPVRRTAAATTALTLGAGALAPWLLDPLSLPTAAVLSALAPVILWLGFLQAGWRGRQQIARVSWTAEGRWLLTLVSGGVVEAELDGDTRVASGLIWLRWRSASGGGAARRTLFLSRLDLAPADLRRLIARLRLEVQATDLRHAAPAVVAL